MAKPIVRALVGVVLSLAYAIGGCATGAQESDEDAPTARGPSITPADAGGVPCSSPGAACCGSFCNGALRCVEAICVSCGGDGEACCSSGASCSGALSCTLGVCGAATTTPPPAGACGALDQPCCDSGVVCTGGLSCSLAGTCTFASSPPPASECGDDGEACCTSGAVCTPGNLCVDGICRVDAVTPTTPPAGACLGYDEACATSAECCSGDCYYGYCDGDPGAMTPPGTDECSDAIDCFDCTSRDNCGFCDGRCVRSDTGAPPASCFSWAWLSFECGW